MSNADKEETRLNSRNSSRIASRYAIVAYTLATHKSDRRVVFCDPILDKLVPFRDDPLSSGDRTEDRVIAMMRLHVALCHRFADDLVAGAVESGLRQLAVLDAGLNTICYRRPYPNMHLFEVDVEPTQRWKRQGLASFGVVIPPTLRYIEIGENRDLAGAAFGRAGYDFDASTVVIWMDSAQFLPQIAFENTVDWLDRHHGPLEFVFSYLQPPSTMPPHSGIGLRYMVEFMSRTMDPIVSFHDPVFVREILRRHKFDKIDDVGWRKMLEIYLPAMRSPTDTLGAHVTHAARKARRGMAAQEPDSG